jgi:hypothetical protein
MDDTSFGEKDKYLRTFGDTVQHLVLPQALSAEQFSNQMLMAADHCHNLTSIEIRESKITSALATLLSANRSLTSLHCSEQLDALNLSALKRFCPGLQRFHARGKMKVDDSDLHYVAALRALRVLQLPAMRGLENSNPLFIIATHCSHLVEVRLDVIEAETVGKFAQFCPNIEKFEVTLCESIRVAEITAITKRWVHLSTLVLLQNTVDPIWTMPLERALVNLIQRCHSLSTLICMESPLAEQIGTAAELCGHSDRPLFTRSSADGPFATSQLQRLWFQEIDIESVQTIAGKCPLLAEVFLAEPVSPELCTALGTMQLKSVGLRCSEIQSSALASLSGLNELRLWNIEKGFESSLAGVCQRSPLLQTLSLHFAKRPDLRVLPMVLAHVPGLLQLSFSAAEEDPDMDENVAMMAKKFARALCPKVAFEIFVL